MRRSLVLTSFGVALVTPALGQTITSTGCVAPSAFETCYNKATADAFTCTTACHGEDICVLACGCAMYEIQIGCLLESCWNKAYTCEYQKFAVNFAGNCLTSTAGVPFWPAPAGASGACSCNLETIYDTVYTSMTEVTTCTNRVTADLLTSNPLQASKNDTGCQCCGASGAVSSVYDTCPDTNPSLAGLDGIMAQIKVLSGGGSFSICDSTLSKFNCESDLEFPALPNNGAYYANSNLPANGTKTLSDVGGPLTTAPFGSVTTISFSTTSYVLTAATYNVANVDATTAATGVVGATGTQTAAASTTSKSAAAATGFAPSWVGVILSCGALLAMD